jgi:hypothetical protein
MPKHKNQVFTLDEIRDLIPSNSCETWYEIMEIDIPGIADAIQEARAADDREDHDASQAAWDRVDAIVAEWYAAHQHDLYEVSWSECVTCPRYNSDASYSRISTADFVAGELQAARNRVAEEAPDYDPQVWWGTPEEAADEHGWPTACYGEGVSAMTEAADKTVGRGTPVMVAMVGGYVVVFCERLDADDVQDEIEDLFELPEDSED